MRLLQTCNKVQHQRIRKNMYNNTELFECNNTELFNTIHQQHNTIHHQLQQRSEIRKNMYKIKN